MVQIVGKKTELGMIDKAVTMKYIQECAHKDKVTFIK